MAYKLDLSESPIRKARMGRNLSLKAAAEECGINSQTLYYAECGVYSEIPLSIVTWLTTKCGCYLPVLYRDYSDFVFGQRTKFGWYYNFPAIVNLPTPDYNFAPLEQFWTSLSATAGETVTRSAFAKGLCIQPAILYRVERGTTLRLPLQVRAALRDAGLPVGVVGELDARTEEYYGYRRHRAA